jgi:hypothetical protein
MAIQHELFFKEPGTWLGQGVISFTMTQDQLRFYARWTVTEVDLNDIYCTQEIEIDGMSDKMENSIHITDVSQGKFKINLENSLWGVVQGEGLISDETVAWEFRRQGEGFEGLEVYEKSGEGQYLLKADYLSPDMYRTMIEGELWKK